MKLICCTKCVQRQTRNHLLLCLVTSYMYAIVVIRSTMYIHKINGNIVIHGQRGHKCTVDSATLNRLKSIAAPKQKCSQWMCKFCTWLLPHFISILQSVFIKYVLLLFFFLLFLFQMQIYSVERATLAKIHWIWLQLGEHHLTLIHESDCTWLYT